jgi:tetratricopeptide (TPR) repeat protein
MKRFLLLISAALLIPPPVRAGLYYSGENVAEFPAQWRGFLLDHRSLRALAAKPAANLPDTSLRREYREALARLEKKTDPDADDLADLGALYVRTSQPGKAVEVLRSAQRKYPTHFHIAANLGTAWQMQGDLEQAAAALRQSVRLAPPKLRAVEELHLRLVESRQKQRNAQQIDDLFGVTFGNDAGAISAEEHKKLPGDAVALTQRLALSLPGDARVLWQLGELANAYGDVRTAAALFDGCVSELGLTAAELRQRRQAFRDAADKLGPASRTDNTGHGGHTGLAFKSPRPLVHKLDASTLLPLRGDGPTPLPWAVLAETTLDARARPTFHDYLKKLDGKPVSMTGYMQPLGDDFDLNSFLLLEYPVGCWFCEMPAPTALMLVELPPGKSQQLRRGLVKITGKLKLNAKDPEDFLYSLQDAFVGEVD